MNTTSNSNSLFHYTNTYENLCGIIRNGFKPNFCKETLLNGSIIGLPMVSFCDIPITKADNFRTYGKYAVGMERDWGISKGINPITYIASNNISTTYSLVLDILHIISEQFRIDMVESFLRSIKPLIEQCKNNNTDVDNEDILSLYIKLKESPERSLFKLLVELENTLIGYTKLYASEDSRHGQVINYNDNEWRYIVSPSEGHKWLHGENEYAVWRGDSKQKPTSSFDAIDFDSDDIRYIIVEKEIDAVKLISDISKMKTIGGKKYEDDTILKRKKLLMIKNIISFERLGEDF